MKKVLVITAVLFMVAIGGFGVSAATVEELYAEQLEASGGEELIRALPEETQTLLRDLGIDALDPDAFSALDSSTLWDELWEMMSSALRGPLATGGTVLAVVLLHAWVNGLRHTLRTEEPSAVFGAVCALSVCGGVILPLSECIAAVSEAMTSTKIFMISFTPVYAGVLLSSGRAAAALSFQSVTLAAAQAMAWLSGSIVVPLMTVSLALGVTGAITPELNLGSVGKWLARTAVWILTLGMMLFSGLLSLQNLTACATDNLGTRALKFSISSFVPVVGSSLSEAFSTIRGCLHLLHSTLGAFGIAATAFIVLPPLLQCIGWNILLSVCRTAADMFELRALSGVLEAAGRTVRCLIGVLAASSSFLWYLLPQREDDMDEIRAWSAALCLAALGCSAIRLLVPKNGTGNLLQLMIGTFFICCLFMPLMELRSFTGLDIGDLPVEVTAELLEDTVTQQLQARVEDTVVALTEQRLAEQNITAEQITVITDISDEGGIYIQQVTITVDKQTVPIAKTVGEVLAEQLSTTVTVEMQ